MNVTGPSAALSGAPITGTTNESNCTSCHSGTFITSGNSNLNKIFLNGNFHNNGYIPDSTYTISLSFKQAGISKYGFQVTCLSSTTFAPVGTMGTNSSSRIQKLTATVGGNTRQYIEHTQTGTDTVKKDSARWVFTWKAPSSNVGKVKFHVAVMATNSNGSDNGDIVYGKSFEISPSSFLTVADAYSVDSVVCANNNAQMTGKGTSNPTSYSWKFTNAIPLASTQQNPVVKFTTPGTQLAILTTKNAYGASFPDTLKVTVKPSPSAVIGNGSSGTICKGDSILLSANTAGGITYLWSPNNKTTRTFFAKDTGIYNVKVSSSSNGCSVTSNNYKLNWYPKPTINLIKTLTKDTFCDQINETFTASGTNADTIEWYANGLLFTKTKGLSLSFNSSVNSDIFAIAKSLTNCRSLPSNIFKLRVVKKIYPSNFISNKTTSNLDLKWTKTIGIDSVQFSLNNILFKRVKNDTAIALTSLTPSTFYNITIRSFQKGVCPFSDTTISIRTNNCSNIIYNIGINTRLCKGDALNAFVKNLPKSKVSVSFNNQAFSTDTSFSFIPTKSDSLQILILDSLSLSCPPIKEKPAYLVDTFLKDNGIYNFNVSSCQNQYKYRINPLYQKYEFYRNKAIVASGISNEFDYTGLISGDQLSVKVFNNTCAKTIGLVGFTLLPPAVATYTLSRNWKTYTFLPNDTNNVNYAWYINDTFISSAKILVKDMSNYNNKTAVVSLSSSNFQTCKDSSAQSINFPNFLKVADITNYQLNIYPNPFDEQLQITTNLSHYNLTIYDNLGRTVLNFNDLNASQSLNTSGWEKGLYHVVLSNDNLKLDRILIKVQ